MLIYRETQRFRQIWLRLFLLSLAVLALVSLVLQVILDRPVGNNPASDSLLIVVAVVFGFGLPLLFYTMHLTVEVRSDGLYIRFFPFHFSFLRIAPEDLKTYEVRTYSPLREYGGWGIRYSKGGKAYNVSGNRGVQLELSNGKRILIGSQKPEELAEAMASAFGTAASRLN